MRTRFGYLFIFSYFLVSFFSEAKAQSFSGVNEISISDTFPVPKENKHLLFYIQRTHNKNTIVYELNYNADRTVNEKNPVKVYWVRYSDNGETAPLSYIQRNYAYGIESVITDYSKKTFKLNLVSYKKRSIYLMKSETDKLYHAYIMMNNKLVYFSKAFAKIEGGTFWVPHIKYVELTGRDSMTGKKMIEKIIP